MLNTQRHAPVGRVRTIRPASRSQGLPQVYRGRARKVVRDIYDRDLGEPRRGGRFRWVLSTFLAAGVGAVAIGVVLFGSLDPAMTREGILPALHQFREARLPRPAVSQGSADGLNWAVPKSDLLQMATATAAARHIIHEQVQVRRDNRPFIQIRPYMRIVARLSDVPPSAAEKVPPFNPLKLYAPDSTDEQAGEGTLTRRSDVRVRVVELLGGMLPNEDGQELDDAEVAELVARAEEEAEDLKMRPSLQPDTPSPEELIAEAGLRIEDPDQTSADPNTTVLYKSVASADTVDDEELQNSEVRVVRVAAGDTLAKILRQLGALRWQINAMLQAARPIFPESALQPGQEVHVTLVPSLVSDRLEPVRFSVFAEGHQHKVTVYRNSSGEYAASAEPYHGKLATLALGDSDRTTSASLYTSIYHAALLEGIPPETIMQVLRIHAYETDFRRRVSPGDFIDFFFDVKEDDGYDSAPGELLYTSLTAGGESRRFWRFRTPDGVVDYYDEYGNNSKRFLMRRPVRGESIRLTSGYGFRQHPVINVPKMHTGIDWAAPTGTPIMAAGNGVVEEAGRKGGYGNYVRIRHANGYQTAYGHMSKIAPNIQPGVKVKQGQIIGYVGCTGMCSGPHLHYEVLVNNRFVNPLTLQVPRERQLTGRQLADFQKERARIEDLMRRAPVMTASR